MLHSISERTNWRAVILGWAVAIAAGIVLNLLFEAAHVLLFGGEALNAASLTSGVVAISLVSGPGGEMALRGAVPIEDVDRAVEEVGG